MKTLDCKGLACPEPVLRTRELIEKQKPAEFMVVVDNSTAVENITRFVNNNGYTVAKVQEKENLQEIYLKKYTKQKIAGQ